MVNDQQFHKVTIAKYHKLGHFQYECPDWEKNAHYAELDETEEMLLMAHAELDDKTNDELWLLDSGCSNYMTGNKQWFTDIDEDYQQTVKLGNNFKMAVVGRGNIRLHANGITQAITNVYYVPELKNNLISIRQLTGKGVSVLIQNGECRCYHSTEGLFLQTKMPASRMFAFHATLMSQVSTCFKTVVEDETHLWHCSYGHLNFKGLKTLKSKKMVTGLLEIRTLSKLCKDCIMGKQ